MRTSISFWQKRNIRHHLANPKWTILCRPSILGFLSCQSSVGFKLVSVSCSNKMSYEFQICFSNVFFLKKPWWSDFGHKLILFFFLLFVCRNSRKCRVERPKLWPPPPRLSRFYGQSDGIVILGATNRSEAIDPALLRPGRHLALWEAIFVTGVLFKKNMLGFLTLIHYCMFVDFMILEYFGILKILRLARQFHKVVLW